MDLGWVGMTQVGSKEVRTSRSTPFELDTNVSQAWVAGAGDE